MLIDDYQFKNSTAWKHLYLDSTLEHINYENIEMFIKNKHLTKHLGTDHKSIKNDLH